MTEAKNSILFMFCFLGFACVEQSIPTLPQNAENILPILAKPKGFKYAATLDKIFENPRINQERMYCEPLYEHIYAAVPKNPNLKRYQINLNYPYFKYLYFENIHLVQKDSILKNWEVSIQSGQNWRPVGKKFKNFYKETDFLVPPFGSAADKARIKLSPTSCDSLNYTGGFGFMNLRKVEIEPYIIQKFVAFLDSCTYNQTKHFAYMSVSPWCIEGYEFGYFASLNWNDVSGEDEKIIYSYIHLILKAAGIKNQAIIKELEKYAMDI